MAKYIDVSTEAVGAKRMLVLRPLGDLTQRPELKELTEAIKIHPEAAGVVIDLSSIERADSAGLGELVLAFGAATGQGQKLLLAAAPENLKQVVRLARLDRMLLFSDTLAAALQEL